MMAIIRYFGQIKDFDDSGFMKIIRMHTKLSLNYSHG